MSVIWCEIWLWRREDVCEGVGKQEDCDQRDEIEDVCVALRLLSVQVLICLETYGAVGLESDQNYSVSMEFVA